jgi:uncharacterized protein (DUF488 family)
MDAVLPTSKTRFIESLIDQVRMSESTGPRELLEKANQMHESRREIELFTIGHSNLAGKDFVATLRDHEIAKVVDVRSTPYSQYAPQFNRLDLAQSLSNAGIEYEFAGESLGGRPSDPSCYKNGQLPPPKADFLALVDYDAVATRSWYLDGIERLIESATKSKTAIMCSEEDPSRCHRHHLIAQTLLEGFVRVWHIRKSGECEPATKVQRRVSDEPRLEQANLL